MKIFLIPHNTLKEISLYIKPTNQSIYKLQQSIDQILPNNFWHSCQDKATMQKKTNNIATTITNELLQTNLMSLFMWEDPRAKAPESFAILSIYKTSIPIL